VHWIVGSDAEAEVRNETKSECHAGHVLQFNSFLFINEMITLKNDYSKTQLLPPNCLIQYEYCVGEFYLDT